MRPPLAALAPLAAVLGWVTAFLVDPSPFPTWPSVFMMALGLLALATVSTTGLMVLGARWAFRLGWVVIALCAGIAAARPIDPVWWGALIVTAIAAAGLFSVHDRTRKLPSAAGPPARAVILPLTLLSVPTVMGLTASGAPWAVSVVSAAGWAGAFLYARVVWGGLAFARVGFPILVLATTPFLEVPALVAAVVISGCIAFIAWHPSVKTAFHPPRTPGSTFAIPPELAPGDILDAAGVDDRGRREP